MATVRRQRDLLQILEDHETNIRRLRATLARVSSGGLDHGGLAGLGDDDHPQYLLAATHAADPHSDYLPLSGGDLTGRLKIGHSLAGPPYAQLRIANGATNEVLIRHDGGNFYMLVSDTADATWNSLRPFNFNVTSGLVTLANGLEMTGSDIDLSQGNVLDADTVRSDAFRPVGATSDLVFTDGGGTSRAYYDYSAGRWKFSTDLDMISTDWDLRLSGVIRMSLNSNYTQFAEPGGSTRFWVGSSDIFYNATTNHFRSTGSTEYATLTNVGFKHARNGGSAYVELNGGSTDSQITIWDTNPQIWFARAGDTAPGKSYWFHHTGSAFYLLRDSTSGGTPTDGAWDSPHPWWVLNSDGSFNVGNKLYSGYTYANTSGSSANVYVASSGLFLRATSGRKYKSEITYDVDFLADLELKPARFWRKDDERTMIGFIADDLIDQYKLLGSFDPETKKTLDDNFDDRGVMAVMAAKINRLEREVKLLKSGRNP